MRLLAGVLLLLVSVSGAGLAQAPPSSSVAPARKPQPQDTLVSPEVHADRSVTFRLRAPNAAEVTLTGDWMATIDARFGGTTKMAKGADGVWTFTSPPLEPTVHLYYFTIDGLNIADPVNPVVKLRNRTSGSLVEVPGTPAPVWQLQAVPRGTVELDCQHSAVYNDEHPFAVYLPPGYKKSTARYPVLYLVHGSGDVYASWTNAGAANVILDNLIAQKKAVPMIIVMPYNGSDYPHLPLTRPAPGTLPFEDYMVKELIPYVDTNYRTLADRKHRAMAGLSAGSGATFNVGMKHSELISQFGLFSAGVLNTAAASRYPEFASGKAAESKFDLMWISCGRQDTDLAGIEDFVAIMKKNGVQHTFVTREGGHVWPVWRWSLAEFAPLLFRQN
jgi:enterochelin esterase-like enzyme